LVVLAAHIQVQQIIRLQPELRIRLHIDLQRQTEFVELVDVGRPQIGCQRREHVPDRDAQRLGSRPVHRHRDMRRARPECRKDVLQLGIAVGLFDDLLGDITELSIVKAAAQQLDLHLQAAGIADPLDRWRRQYKEPAVGKPIEFALKALGDRQNVRLLCLAPLIPRLEHDKVHAGISEVGKIVEDGQSRYCDHPVHSWRIVRDLGRLIQRRRCAPERGAIGQLRDAAIKAMDELFGPIIGITLVLMAVFLPSAFVPGLSGQMFAQFALVIAVTALISAVNAATLKPTQCALWLRPPAPVENRNFFSRCGSDRS
jgi:hypothetical protein